MTNRERLQRALRDLHKIAQDEAISPTPYSLLMEALLKAERAGQFALDMNERDRVRS